MLRHWCARCCCLRDDCSCRGAICWNCRCEPRHRRESGLHRWISWPQMLAADERLATRSTETTRATRTTCWRTSYSGKAALQPLRAESDVAPKEWVEQPSHIAVRQFWCIGNPAHGPTAVCHGVLGRRKRATNGEHRFCSRRIANGNRVPCLVAGRCVH